MFGYVKPRIPELKVREYETYRSVYCGICRELKKRALFLPFALSYDFVYLALVRAALTGEVFRTKMRRCPVHPLKKRKTAEGSDSIKFTSAAALILVIGKLEDGLRDSDVSFFKKMIFAPLASYLRRRLARAKKKDPYISELSEKVSASLEAYRELEKSGCTDPDVISASFGEAMAAVMSHGLEGSAYHLARSLGDTVGRIVCLFDAADDMSSDAAKGCYNPFIAKYGSVEAAVSDLGQIDLTISLYIEKADALASLLPESGDSTALVRNISSIGLSSVLKGIILKIKEPSAHKKGRSND